MTQAMAQDKMTARTSWVWVTGLSCARFLAAQGVPVAVADSRTEPPGLLR